MKEKKQSRRWEMRTDDQTLAALEKLRKQGGYKSQADMVRHWVLSKAKRKGCW